MLEKIYWSNQVFFLVASLRNNLAIPIRKSQARQEKGVTGAPAPLTDCRGQLCVDQQFSRLKLGTQLKDHDDQHC